MEPEQQRGPGAPARLELAPWRLLPTRWAAPARSPVCAPPCHGQGFLALQCVIHNLKQLKGRDSTRCMCLAALCLSLGAVFLLPG